MSTDMPDGRGCLPVESEPCTIHNPLADETGTNKTEETAPHPLIGTIWQSTRGYRQPRYVRVMDTGPNRAVIANATADGKVHYTLGRGIERRTVKLTHDGTRLGGYKRAETGGPR